MIIAGPQLVEQPRLREVPVALQGRERDPQRFGRRVLAQPCEVSELDDPAGARIDRLEFRQRLVQRDDAFVTLDGSGRVEGGGRVDVAQRDLEALIRAFLGIAGSRVIDQDVPSPRAARRSAPS
jgi:hypothetical protein